MLRSCYAADMAFFYDSEVTLPVYWYFVPSDRETLPFATSFASRIYERTDEPQEPIGERYKPVPWRGGQADDPVPVCGKCGNADAWLRGVSIDDPFPDVYPGTNIPLCCCPPSPQFFGGMAIGGFVGSNFPGEQASGGRFNDPFKGEAASGGESAIVFPFDGEAASGGVWASGFAGEAASGGTFMLIVEGAGGIALGGEFAIVLPFEGGIASGGGFTEPSTPWTTPCLSDPPPQDSVRIRLTLTSGTCSDLDGLDVTATHPGSLLNYWGVTADYSYGPVMVDGSSWIISVWCGDSLSLPWVMTLDSDPDTSATGNGFVLDTNAETPLNLSASSAAFIGLPFGCGSATFDALVTDS